MVDRRHPPRLLHALLAVALIVGVASVGAAAPSSGACSSPTTRKLSGTIEGEDHRYVRAQLSFELFDADGDRIGLDGCALPSGYSTVFSVNTDLDGQGSNNPSGHTKSWTLSNLPANAVDANIEIYPKSPSGTDLTRYGRAMRKHVVIPNTSVDVELPLNCGFADNSVFGRNGSITGHITRDGHPVETYRVSAFSLAADTESMPLGFGIDSDIPDGEFSVDALAPNQPYIVFIKLTSTSTTQEVKFVDVEPCGATTLDFVFGKFQDVPYHHPFFEEISWMLDEDLSDGYSGDVYRPVADVSRQAVAAWIYRLNGEPAPPFDDSGLHDVEGTPFEDEIEWMVETGRATGFADGSYKPLRCMTRQAMVAFLYREAQSPPGPFDPPGFSDVPADHPFVDEIAWAVSAGVANGYDDGTFRPGACMTRQAGAAFLFRAFA
jgi:hypothetical protein